MKHKEQTAMKSAKFSKETKQQATAFDHIGSKYENVFGNNQTQITAIEWLSNRLPPQAHILDVGCGTGVPTAKMLIEAGFEVLGIDISTEMLKIAEQNVPLGKFQLMDMAEIDFSGQKFQAIVAFFSLLMLKKSTIVTTLNRLVESLQPDGYFLLSMVEGNVDYAQISFLGRQLHFSAYPQEELEQFLKQVNLKILEVKTVDFSPAQGLPPEKQLFFFCQRENL